jgi:hypothetical protein
MSERRLFKCIWCQADIVVTAGGVWRAADYSSFEDSAVCERGPKKRHSAGGIGA